MVGTAMLWVGWYGFNAGSAVAADGIAANAFTTTTLATATAALIWALLEKIFRGKASVLGYCTGAVAGLVVITPACGFVNPTGGVIIGVLAAVVPYIAVSVLKPALGYDDALIIRCPRSGRYLGRDSYRTPGHERSQSQPEGPSTRIAAPVSAYGSSGYNYSFCRGDGYHWVCSETGDRLASDSECGNCRFRCIGTRRRSIHLINRNPASPMWATPKIVQL